ncbi:MAG: hypothetical protein KatS3mg098_275 [Candidatus Parcubacteria bacterium]|nr:MAG: hypothetical protein KatS3mg098_275 [Candidatus Parcubacteria bacterium]
MLFKKKFIDNKKIRYIFLFFLILTFIFFSHLVFSYTIYDKRLNVYQSDGTTLVGKFGGIGGVLGIYDFWGRINAGGQTLNTIAIVIFGERNSYDYMPTNNVLLYDSGTDNFCDSTIYINNFQKKHMITGDCSTFQGRASSTWYYSSTNCSGTVYLPNNGFYTMPTLSATEGYTGNNAGVPSYYYCLSLNHNQKAFWRGGRDYNNYPSCVYNDSGSSLMANRSYQSYRTPTGTCVNATGTLYSSLIISPTNRLCGSIASGTGECVIKP